MKDFEGKNILVVGGTSGIGKSITKKLKERGAKVYNASRSQSEDADENIKLDVTADFEKIDGLPEELHGVAYCPGTINLKPFQSLKVADFESDFSINVLGAVKVLKAAHKSLKTSKNSGVVLFSTVAVSQGMNFHSSVAASKGALEGITRSLAAEFSGHKIRVNSIAPSLTDTPMAKHLLSSDEKRKASDERHPLKRVGNPEEIAEAAVYLLSANASWITGQILHLDGGMSAVRPI